MTINLNFDASQVQPATVMEPLPTGWYPAAITKVEVKDSNNNPQNKMLACEITIIDGPAKGRKLFDNINLWNDNPTTVDIAYKTLSAIGHATGVIRCQTAEQYVNIPLKVRVKLAPPETKRDELGNVVKQYEAKNVVKGYDHANSEHPLVTSITGTASAGGVAGAPVGTPPWAGGGAPAPSFAGAPAGFPAPSMPAPPATNAGWTPPAGQQPWNNPGAGAAPPMAPPAPQQFAPPPVAAPFPPEGWVQHPQNPAFYYKGQEVVSEADLRARSAAPAVPAAPQFAPPSMPGVPAAAAGPGPTPPWAR
jgi:hypothetical protein